LSINEHADEFAGLPVRDFDPEDGIEDPEGTIYRLAVDYDSEDPLSVLLARFLKDPSAARVPGLIIGAWQGDDSSASSGPIVEALVAAREVLTNLRALFLGDITSEENEISWIQQSDVTALFDAYPNLEHFRARGGMSLVIGKLRHENLRSLVIESGGLDGEVVRGIGASDLPRLEHLELWLGTEEYGGTTRVADLKPLLGGKVFPRLRYLGLRDSEIADEIAAAVAEAPVLKKIRVLDLWLGNLSDDGAAALLVSPGVAQLEKLDIHHHFVSPALAEQLEDLGIEVDASEPQEADEDDRYIAMGE
jgi:hypothetical protein